MVGLVLEVLVLVLAGVYWGEQTHKHTATRCHVSDRQEFQRGLWGTMEAHRRDPLNYPGTSREDFTDRGDWSRDWNTGVYSTEGK